MIQSTRATWSLFGLMLLAHSGFAHAEDQFFDAEGVTLRYVDQGEGTPVVLLHGFWLNLEEQWDQPGVIATLVDAGYRVIAYDSRGHGHSDKLYDPEQYGFEMVYDIGRLLDHLGIDRAHIAGYSMGARLTNKFREINPDRVLTATLGGYGWGREFEVAGHTASSPLTESQVDEWMRSWSVPTAEIKDASALAAILPRSAEWKAEEQSLRANTTPTLALIGDEDPRRPYAEAMLNLMPSLELKVVPGTHLSAFGQPIFVQELLSFLGRYSDL